MPKKKKIVRKKQNFTDPEPTRQDSLDLLNNGLMENLIPAASDNTNVSLPPTSDFSEVAPLEPWAGSQFRGPGKSPGGGELGVGPSPLDHVVRTFQDAGTKAALLPRTLITLKGPSNEELVQGRSSVGNQAELLAQGATWGMADIMGGTALERIGSGIASGAYGSKHLSPKAKGFHTRNLEEIPLRPTHSELMYTRAVHGKQKPLTQFWNFPTKKQQVFSKELENASQGGGQYYSMDGGKVTLGEIERLRIQGKYGKEFANEYESYLTELINNVKLDKHNEYGAYTPVDMDYLMYTQRRAKGLSDVRGSAIEATDLKNIHPEDIYTAEKALFDTSPHRYGGPMKNKRKLSRREILRNMASGKYVLGGDTSITPELAPEIPQNAGYDVSATQAGLLDDVGSKQPNQGNFNTTLGYAATAGNVLGNISANVGDKSARVPENQGLNTGMDAALGSIPIVGQFYQIGSGVGEAIGAAEDAARAKGNTGGANVAAGFRGAIDPASGWSKNAELYNQGIIDKKTATKRMISQFFLPGLSNALSSRDYSDHLDSVNAVPVPESATFSAGDGSYDDSIIRPVTDESFYGKYGGQMKSYDHGGDLTHFNGLPHELGGINIKPGVEVEDGESAHKDFVFSDKLVNPTTKESYSKAAKRLERRYKDKNDPRVTNDLDIVLERLKSTQEAQKRIEGIAPPTNVTKLQDGGGIPYNTVGPLASREEGLPDSSYYNTMLEVLGDPVRDLQAPLQGGPYMKYDVLPEDDPYFVGPPRPTPLPPKPPKDKKDPNFNYRDLALLGSNVVASNIGNVLGLNELRGGYDTVRPELIQPQKQSITQLLENIKAGVATSRYNNRMSGKASIGNEKALLAEGLKARGTAIENLENTYLQASLQADQFNAQSKTNAADLTARNKGVFDTRKQQIYDSIGSNISGAISEYGQVLENRELSGLLDEYFEDFDYSKGKWKRRGKKKK